MKKILLIAITFMLSQQIKTAKSEEKTVDNIITTGQMTINIENILYPHGSVYVALVSDENKKKFLKESDYKGSVLIDKVGNNQIILKDIPYGKYAAFVYYDLNENNKLDANGIGIPKEPTGLSNNPKPRWGKPLYKNSVFEFNEQNNTINITLKNGKKYKDKKKKD